MKMNLYKKLCTVLVLMLILTSLSYAVGETTLYLLGAGKNGAAYQMLTQSHPEVNVETESNIFESTTEMINAILTGEFPYDTFVMRSNSFDVKQMFIKGYCADVSASSLLQSELKKMYEPIEQFLTHDGNIRGIPFNFYMEYYAYNPDAWAVAGLLEEDVPTSFDEYLVFLEAWTEHIKENPEDGICVCNTFDSDLYGEHSYINYLVDQLLTNYIMQCNYAEETIRFDTPLFRDMLERCQKVGADLYIHEPELKTDLSLFDDLYGMHICLI